MIEIFSFRDLGRYGDTYVEQSKLRYQELILRNGWDSDRIAVASGMEQDAYDNPRTVYLTYRDNAGVVRGTIRINPTLSPYMVEEVFPDYLNGPPPKGHDIWESSRLVIDQDAPIETQSRAWREINIAGLEYNIARGVKYLIMFTPYWFVEPGIKGKEGMVKLTALGPSKAIDGIDHVVTMTEEITPELLERERQFTGISEKMLAPHVMLSRSEAA